MGASLLLGKKMERTLMQLREMYSVTEVSARD